MEILHLMGTVILYKVKKNSRKISSVTELVPSQGHILFPRCSNQRSKGEQQNESAIGLWTHNKKKDQDETNNTQPSSEKYS